MVIKKLVLKYRQVAFTCNSIKELEIFINEATKNIVFIKGGFFMEDKNYLIKNYIPHLKEGKCYGLICLIFNKEVNKRYFNFYSRDNHVKYTDWNKYKIIDYSKELRKRKLNKLKQVNYISYNNEEIKI